MKIYTIGTSTRSISEFISALKQSGIEIVIDVRSNPRPHHTPQFSPQILEKNLEENGISYIHINELGASRNSKEESVNPEWRNKTFRGYADHMDEPEFKRGIEMLTKIAIDHSSVIMCHEAMPERCHRSLISDWLSVNGWKVVHLINEAIEREHKLTKELVVNNGRLTYQS